MSEPYQPGQEVNVIEGGEKFNVRGQEFSLDLLEASFAFQDIQANLKPDQNSRHYYQGCADWIEQKTGIKVTLGEADVINRQIDILYERRKRFFLDALESTRTSPSSTE